MKLTASLLAAAITIAVVIPGEVSAAGSKPQAQAVTAQASATRVEVGQPFTIQLQALIEADQPELTTPRGVAVVGQSAMRFNINGKLGLQATWQVIINRPGHIVFPGPTVLSNGKRLAAAPIAIDVTPSTGHRQPNNPFLLPGGPTIQFPGLFGADDEPDDEVKDSPDLALAQAPDGQVFLRAIADKKTAVVGEQVTVSFYKYFRADYPAVEAHEAALVDFRRVPLVANPGTGDGDLRARVGKEQFHVKLLERVAAFPLRSGDLHVGSFKLKLLPSPRLGPYNERESNDEIIHVGEPPKEYRPPGYRPGDVGQFQLSAIVQPRRIEQGDAVSVQVRVTGNGNFPESLRMPERTGLDWLDPEKKEAISAQSGVIAGWRSFGYVARLKESGHVELGTLELPYWNPSARRYEIARAELGAVDVGRASPPGAASAVAPAASAAASSDEVDAFAGVGAARLALGAYRPSRLPPWGDGSLLWLLLAAPPLLVGLSFAGSAAAKKARERRSAGESSAATRTARALDDAAAAEQKGDVKELSAALERAIHLAVEGATGLRSRGVLLADLPAELERLGVAEDLAADVHGALEACATIRFDPDAASAAHDLGERARRAVRALQQQKPS